MGHEDRAGTQPVSKQKQKHRIINCIIACHVPSSAHPTPPFISCGHTKGMVCRCLHSICMPLPRKVMQLKGPTDDRTPGPYIELLCWRVFCGDQQSIGLGREAMEVKQTKGEK